MNHLKRILLFLVLTPIFFLIQNKVFAENEEIKSGGVVFIASGNGTAFVSGLENKNLAKVIIPEFVFSRRNEPLRVVLVMCDAFKGCSNITKVVFPPSIERIGFQAFNGCTKLKEVIFQDPDHSHLQVIEMFAFKDSALEEIKIPKSVKLILEKSFCGCNGLKKIVLRNESDLMYMDYSLENKVEIWFENGIECSVKKASAKITKYKNLLNEDSIIVPKFVRFLGKNIPIVAIDEKAFAGNQNLITTTTSSGGLHYPYKGDYLLRLKGVFRKPLYQPPLKRFTQHSLLFYQPLPDF